ncbi:MAG: hypothetical protein H6834_11155 [Planctomycetes bacterium]|nr:hypothetical protein [Planctomycetota bacterium]
MPLANALLDFLSNYDALIGIAVSWLVALFLYWRSRVLWQSKSFANHLNFSLNDVVDDTLHLRTLQEPRLEDVFLSRAAVADVRAACQRTTEGRPFVTLEDDADMGFVLRACLNVLSSLCPETFLADALRQPVAKDTFVMGLSYEVYGSMRTRKPRVVLIRESLLKRFVDAQGAPPITVRNTAHEGRLTTLQAMARAWFGGDQAARRALRTIELGVVAAPASPNA